jgi:PAS domain S-box-containing protein
MPHNKTVAELTEELRELRALHAATVADSERLLRFVSDLAGVGHWRVDLGLNTLAWSERTFEIHGLSPESYTPDVGTATELYHPDDRAQVQESFSKAIEAHADIEYELRIVRGDGEIRQVVSRGRPDLMKPGRFAASSGFSRM